MYLIQCITGSAHEKVGVWTGPKLRNTAYRSSSSSSCETVTERYLGLREPKSLETEAC